MATTRINTDASDRFRQLGKMQTRIDTDDSDRYRLDSDACRDGAGGRSIGSGTACTRGSEDGARRRTAVVRR